METINQKMAIIITLPSNIEWTEYAKELDAARAGSVLNFKVSNFPNLVGIGDRCYLTWRGYVRGYMTITGFSEKEFECETTGRPWRGKFIERSGNFTYLCNPYADESTIDPKLKYKGFQNYRYVYHNQFSE